MAPPRLGGLDRHSWQPRTAFPLHGHGYGYGWFIVETAGHPHYYGWGYGGQMLHIIPSLALTIAITSDPNVRSREEGHMAGLRSLVAENHPRRGGVSGQANRQAPHEVAGGMKHRENRHDIHADLIDDQIGQEGHRKFAGARQAAGSAHLGKAVSRSMVAAMAR